jgi:hypothetical protein
MSISKTPQGDREPSPVWNSTLDEELTKNELFAIVGEQDFYQNEDDNV